MDWNLRFGGTPGQVLPSHHNVAFEKGLLKDHCPSDFPSVWGSMSV